jgi:hypothetical protein
MGFVVIMNQFTALQHFLKIYFDQDCAGFGDVITEDDIKDGLEGVVTLYDKKCGPEAK